jgi:hypothetical protein
VLIGEKWPLALNPEQIARMEPKPQEGSSGPIVEVLIWLIGEMSDCNPIRVFVVRFEDLLRAMDSALRWRRTWLHE